jgi:hypothetical protein
MVASPFFNLFGPEIANPLRRTPGDARARQNDRLQPEEAIDVPREGEARD